MKVIVNTFVLVSADCPVQVGTAPKTRDDKPTIAVLQHQLLTSSPYIFTLEDLMREIHVQREELTQTQARKHREEIDLKLFGKPYPCMRASPLPKTYGWGVHHDDHGRIAIYGVETSEYQRLSKADDVEVLAAMRSKRKS